MLDLFQIEQKYISIYGYIHEHAAVKNKKIYAVK